MSYQVMGIWAYSWFQEGKGALGMVDPVLYDLMSEDRGTYLERLNRGLGRDTIVQSGRGFCILTITRNSLIVILLFFNVLIPTLIS